jgi:hypothetical protein
MQVAKAYGMSAWVRNGLWVVGAAAVMCILGICNAWAGASNAQTPSDVPDVRSRQGQPCGTDADCAAGLTCFNNGRINYCTGGPPQVYPNGEGGPGLPAKTCQTASDCGPGDWTCGAGFCVTTGGRRCTSNADCVGGWVCKWVGGGSLCFPP